MRIASLRILVVVLLMGCNPATAESTEQLVELRTMVEYGIAIQVAPLVVEELTDSGIASSDIDRIVLAFVEKTTDCVMSAIKESAARRSVDLNEFLPVESLEAVNELFRDETEFLELGESCLTEAATEAGLSLE